MIDTDSETIASDAQAAFPTVRIIERPEHLLGGDVPMNDILLNDIEQAPADLYVQSHSTNPLLRSSTITEALEAFLAARDRYDSLFTVTPLQTRLWTPEGQAINHDPEVLLRTQDLPPVMEENSCLYAFDGDTLRRRKQPDRRAAAAVLADAGGGVGHRRGERLDGRRGALRASGGARVSSARVLITCRQMQNCIDEFRSRFDEQDIEITMPDVVQQPSEDELIAMIGEFDGMIAGDDPLTARVLEHATRMRIISKWGVGVDGIDLDAARAQGIPRDQHARASSATTSPTSPPATS